MIEAASLQISEIGIAGSELLARIHSIAFEDHDGQKWDSKTFEELFNIRGTTGYILKKNDQPIGFILIRHLYDVVEIITFCILPRWCKNGYATYLLKSIIKSLKQKAFKRVFLEVRENNKAAVGLYQKCSFVQIGRREGYYSNSRSYKNDSLVMKLELRN